MASVLSLDRSTLARNVSPPGEVEKPGRSLAGLLAPLDGLATGSTHLIASRGATFETGGHMCELPRYLFLGSQSGDEAIRLGIFAGIHGDEPEGVHALIRFLIFITDQPTGGLTKDLESE